MAVYLTVACGHCQDRQKRKPAFLYPLSVVVRDDSTVLLKYHIRFEHANLIEACSDITGVSALSGGDARGISGWEWESLKQVGDELRAVLWDREVVCYDVKDTFRMLKLTNADCRQQVCMKQASSSVSAQRLRKDPWNVICGDVRALPLAVCDTLRRAHSVLSENSHGGSNKRTRLNNGRSGPSHGKRQPLRDARSDYTDLRSPGHANYSQKLTDSEQTCLLVTGPAGTGKTYMACVEAATQLQEGLIDRIILTRPVVGVDENIGFLPGTMEMKMKPWVQPMIEVIDFVLGPRAASEFKRQGAIETVPLSFMRGRTLQDSFVIADEMQNSSKDQISVLVTRIGQRCKLVILGDLEQTDLHRKGASASVNGLEEMLYVVKDAWQQASACPVSVVSLKHADVMRHPVVGQVLAVLDCLSSPEAQAPDALDQVLCMPDPLSSMYRRIRTHSQFVDTGKPAHAEYSARLQDDNQPIVVVVGPAGTGKTYSACIEGAQQIKSGHSKRIVLLRPNTGVDEDIGFLPGGISDKMAPWAKPMLDACAVVLGRQEVKMMVAQGIIELMPLAYLRGRTLRDSWVIADEMQNSSMSQMRALLTRFGQGCKVIITGDTAQTDGHDSLEQDHMKSGGGSSRNGLTLWLKAFGVARRHGMHLDHIGLMRFQRHDIMRAQVVSQMYSLLDRMRPDEPKQPKDTFRREPDEFDAYE